VGGRGEVGSIIEGVEMAVRDGQETVFASEIVYMWKSGGLNSGMGRDGKERLGWAGLLRMVVVCICALCHEKEAWRARCTNTNALCGSKVMKVTNSNIRRGKGTSIRTYDDSYGVRWST